MNAVSHTHTYYENMIRQQSSPYMAPAPAPTSYYVGSNSDPRSMPTSASQQMPFSGPSVTYPPPPQHMIRQQPPQTSSSYMASPPTGYYAGSRSTPESLPVSASTSSQRIPSSRPGKTYVFAQVGPTLLFLIPPPSSASDRPAPLYRVSVETNMLSPDAPATVVRRGAAENGAVVADMRLKGNAESGEVTMGSKTMDLKKLVQWKYASFKGDRVSEMRWTFDNVKLFWEPYESPDTKELLIKCSIPGSAKNSRTHVATIRPPSSLNSKPQELTIEVPERELGSEAAVLDHIFVASLVFQRGQQQGRRKRGDRLMQWTDGFTTVADLLSVFD